MSLVRDVAAVEASLWFQSVDEALVASTSLGRPMIALGVSASCGPCQALKRDMRSDRDFQQSLGTAVVVEMDAASTEFAAFRQHYPQGFSGAVPMVYVIDANQEVRYARAGYVSPEFLSSQLSQSLAEVGPVLGLEEVAGIQTQLEEIRQFAREGELVAAAQLVQPIAARAGVAQSLVRARGYERQLHVAIRGRLTQLDENLHGGQRMHESAFRVAEMYVQLSNQHELQSQARQILTTHGARVPTAEVVLQAKLLVRARVAESRRDCEAALRSYESILSIDRASPIGSFAAIRLPKVRDALTRK